jgi:hypothetical protein
MGIQIEPPGPVDSLAPQASVTNFGSVTGPTLGTVVAATGTVSAGTYSVVVQTDLNGTVTTADVNNTELLVGATVIVTLLNGDITNTDNTNPAINVTVPSGGATISTKTIGAGSGTATYSQLIVATRIG